MGLCLREREKMRDTPSMIGAGKEIGNTPLSNFQEEKIFVSIRVRPLNEKERARHDLSDWECISGNAIRFKNSGFGFGEQRSSSMDAYAFDRVFGDKCSTQQVYEQGIKEVALSVLRGINSSIFAYGQTSSGKTYTMTGITEYAVRDIYDYIEKHNKDREFVLKFSAMEIYNEAVKDLLNSNSSPLRLLDDPEKGTVVERLTEETLTERSQLQQLLFICAAERTTEETAMNETSSRSHQILRLTVESHPCDYVGTASSGTLIASVNFVDLAGSERASQALSAGTRLREGSHINRSLLTLGTVMRKLSNGRNGHIPYRDSKLTRILQNSLGGNGRTAIICTISPARSQFEQSRNTLFFAGCAKQVTTNARVNVVMSDKVLVKQLQKELARMENELRSLNTILLKERELQIEQMGKEIKELTRQRDLFQSHKENLLQSVGKDQVSREDKDWASESSSIANNIRFSIGSTFETPDRSTTRVSISNEHYLQQPENSEDNFLLDGTPPMFVGPDPCHGWEEIASRADTECEDNCKEVQCIEIKEVETDHKTDADPSIPVFEEREGNSPMTLVKNVDAKSSSGKRHSELSHVAMDNSQDALQQETQELERSTDHLVGLSEKTTGSYESYEAESCTPILAAMSPEMNNVDRETISHPQFSKLEQEAVSPSRFNELNQEPLSPSQFDEKELKTTLPPQLDELKQVSVTSPSAVEKEYSTSLVRFHDKPSESKLHAKKRRPSRIYSQIQEMDASVEEESVMDSDMEDTASVLNFVVRMNEKTKSRSEKDFDDHMVHAKTSGINKHVNRVKGISFHGVPGSLHPSKLERQQRDIIELWDACNVPLVHRSYFFLLIKGELSDSVYLDVELRRLSFLKDTFSTGTNSMGVDGLNVTPNSSLKALSRERKMLSKQVYKKFSRKEREELYRKWHINLKTKHRSIQLAWLLWTNTNDLEHARASAALVGKLVGFIDSGEPPKKTFGLGFFGRRKSSKSQTWKDTMSTLV